MLHDRTLSPFSSSRKETVFAEWWVSDIQRYHWLLWAKDVCAHVCACELVLGRVCVCMCEHMCACVGPRMYVHVCMWTCVRLRMCVHMCACGLVLDPGPHSCEGCREQTLCTQVCQFLTAAKWCFWWKRERRKHDFHFSPGLGPTCLAQSQQKSLKSRFGLINVSRSSAQMGFDSQEEAQLGCFHYQRATGKGLSLRVRMIPQVPTQSFDDHRLSRWAIINTQKMWGLCEPYHMPWVLFHCSRRAGGVSELRLDMPDWAGDRLCTWQDIPSWPSRQSYLQAHFEDEETKGHRGKSPRS